MEMPAVVVGITTDIIFTPPEMRRLAELLPRARYFEIESDLGHDGFLTEHAQLNRILTDPASWPGGESNQHNTQTWNKKG